MNIFRGHDECEQPFIIWTYLFILYVCACSIESDIDLVMAALSEAHTLFQRLRVQPCKVSYIGSGIEIHVMRPLSDILTSFVLLLYIVQFTR